MRKAAQNQVVYERQTYVADLVSNGRRIRAKLIDVDDVEVVDMKFVNLVPTIDIRCSADYIEVITDTTGNIIEGSESAVKRSEFLVVMAIDHETEKPQWKVREFHLGSTNFRV